jgi:hypothetical protein
MGAKQQSSLNQVTIDAEPLDQLEDKAWTIADGIDDALAAVGSIVGDSFRVTVLQIGDELAECAPRRSPADTAGLDNRDARARLCQMQRC